MNGAVPADLRDALSEALETYDLTESASWSDIDALATHVYIEDLDLDPDSIVQNPDGTFSGAVNVYLTLQYGKDDNEGFRLGESFVGEVKGSLGEDGKARIQELTVDTEPFFRAG